VRVIEIEMRIDIVEVDLRMTEMTEKIEIEIKEKVEIIASIKESLDQVR